MGLCGLAGSSPVTAVHEHSCCTVDRKMSCCAKQEWSPAAEQAPCHHQAAAAQPMHSEEPGYENMPSGQRVQRAAVALLTVPALHSLHSDAPRSDMKPAGHDGHAAAIAYE